LLLENPAGEILAFHAKSDAVAVSRLKALMADSTGEQDWWFAGGHLYQVSFAPIVAGETHAQRVLGRLALCNEISAKSILDNGSFGQTDTIIERKGAVMLSSLPADTSSEFEKTISAQQKTPDQIQEINLGGEHYLVNFAELPGDNPVRFYSLESFDRATIF